MAKNNKAKEETINLEELELEEGLDELNVEEEPEPRRKKNGKSNGKVKNGKSKNGNGKQGENKSGVAEGDDIVEIKIDDYLDKSFNLREDTPVDDLINSIKQKGLIHLPVVSSNGKLLDGQRRLLALKKLGYKTIKARVLYEEDEGDQFLISLISNEARKDLDELEKASAYQKALDSGYVKSQKELADLLGLSKGRVSQILSLLNPDKIDEEALEEIKEEVSASKARALKKAPKEKQKEVAKKIKSGAKVSGAKFVQRIPKTELPENVKIEVNPDAVIITFKIPEGTKTMEGFDLVKVIKDKLKEFDPSINDVIKLARKQVLV